MKTHKEQNDELKKELRVLMIVLLMCVPFVLLGVVQACQIIVWLGQYLEIPNW